MNRLSRERRCQIVRCLTQGNGIRPTAELTDTSTRTVMKLLRDLAPVCDEASDRLLRNLPCRTIQVDEIWSFVHCKQKNVPEERQGEWGVGDVWTWTSICADTKLVPAWRLDRRDGCAARAFMLDVARRMAGRIHLTSDGHSPYVDAVEHAFGGAVDYARLVKLFESDAVPSSPQRRYSPGQFVTLRKEPVCGFPEEEKISTSFVERQNLSMRMRMRRFTRLTNGFSKTVENHRAALSLYFFDYNFLRRHQTLRRPPALAAGVVNRRLHVEDLIQMLEEREDSARDVQARTTERRAA